MSEPDATAPPYIAAADELCNRIHALIPEHPEILTIDSAWDLFRVPGFNCDDLQPSWAQASWALGKARSIYRSEHPTSTEATPDA